MAAFCDTSFLFTNVLEDSHERTARPHGDSFFPRRKDSLPPPPLRSPKPAPSAGPLKVNSYQTDGNLPPEPGWRSGQIQF